MRIKSLFCSAVIALLLCFSAFAVVPEIDLPADMPAAVDTQKTAAPAVAKLANVINRFEVADRAAYAMEATASPPDIAINEAAAARTVATLSSRTDFQTGSSWTYSSPPIRTDIRVGNIWTPNIGYLG